MRTIVTRVDMIGNEHTRSYSVNVSYEDAPSFPGEIVKTNYRQEIAGENLGYADAVKMKEGFEMQMHLNAKITAL